MMKTTPRFLSFLFAAATCFLLVSCDRADPAPSVEAEIDPVVPEIAEKPSKKTEEPETEKPEPFSEFPADLSFAEDLSPEQQKTLEDAVKKATSNLDLTAITAALQTTLGGGESWNLGGGKVKTLSPEEAKKMGLNIEELTGNAEGATSNGAAVSNVQIITVGPNDPRGAELLEKLKSSGALPGLENLDPEAITEEVVIEAEPVVIDAESDPELEANIKKHLESGDSEALAAELSKVIQSGIDQVALQQMLGGKESGSSTESKPAE